MVKIIFLFLMVFTIYQSSKGLATDEAVTVDQIVTFLDKYQKDIEKAVKKISSNKKLEKLTMLKYYFKRIFAKNSDIFLRVAQNDLLFAERRKDFSSYFETTLPDFQKNKTSKIMFDIYKNYFNFQKYGYFDEEKVTEKSIKLFVNKNIDDVIPKKLNNLHAYILKSRSGPNLLDSLIEAIYNIDEKDRCDGYGSPQDKFYNFYLSCMTIELLAMTSMINSYGFRELLSSDSGNKKKLKNIIAESKKRMTEYSKEFTLSLANTPINYRNCDPYGDKEHERGSTFIEMFGLYQNILMYSYHLGHDSCSTCENVNLANGTTYDRCYIQLKESTPWDENGVPEDFNSCTTPRNCYGKIHTCKTIWEPEYCMLKDNVRRYKWVRDKYEPQKHSYGDTNSGCSDGQYAHREYEYESYAKFAKCPFCWCVCDDVTPNSKLAVNTISLLPAMSSIARNRVVTGAKMIIKENILHIQVSDAIIGPNYIVQGYSDDWVRLPEMRNDVQASLARGGWGKLKRDNDYVVWNYKTNAINMDEILIEYGRVITGLKFGIKNVEGEHYERIQIRVHSTKYDWKSGKLLKDTEKWHYSDDEHPNKGVHDRLNPLMSNEKTVIDSQTDQYYVLTYSDAKSDAGQTTIPLFEAFDNGANIPAAMSGIGLHHRSSSSENGGFFGLTGYSVDYYKFMSELNPDA